ncbi:MAG: hypothetical protein ACFE89_10720 [Candidatus Hodarchaeota archaeon]
MILTILVGKLQRVLQRASHLVDGTGFSVFVSQIAVNPWGYQSDIITLRIAEQ